MKAGGMVQRLAVSTRKRLAVTSVGGAVLLHVAVGVAVLMAARLPRVADMPDDQAVAVVFAPAVPDTANPIAPVTSVAAAMPTQSDPQPAGETPPSPEAIVHPSEPTEVPAPAAAVAAPQEPPSAAVARAPDPLREVTVPTAPGQPPLPASTTAPTPTELVSSAPEPPLEATIPTASDEPLEAPATASAVPTPPEPSPPTIPSAAEPPLIPSAPAPATVKPSPPPLARPPAAAKTVPHGRPAPPPGIPAMPAATQAKPGGASADQPPSGNTHVTVAAGWQHSLAAWLGAQKTYPDEARRRNAEGSATVRFTVERSGRVLDVVVVRSAGSSILDAAAEALIRNAMLPPFTAEMSQDKITVTVQIRYALKN